MPGQAINRAAIDRWIIEHVPQGGRVLDIGCAEGDLLARLVEEKNVRAVGIELSESRTAKAVQRGLSVHHGNAEEALDHYSDGTFDVVIISLTIQETQDPHRLLQEALRAGKQVIVVFPNFGHWYARWQFAALGHAPKTRNLPHTWYDSPNRHFFTIADWEEFCNRSGWYALHRSYLSAGKRIGLLPNLRAEVAMYILQRKR